MRTTLSLDDDIVTRVKSYAESRELSIGKAVSELVRRGLQAPLKMRVVNGFHVVELPLESPLVTTAHLQKLEDDLR
jgi:hypothetical protein